MSIRWLEGFGGKLCRRAHILAQTKNTNQTLPQLLLGGLRDTHDDNLYQMVKRRTLEARTKKQTNQFPNQPGEEKVVISHSGETVHAGAEVNTAAGSSNPPGANRLGGMSRTTSQSVTQTGESITRRSSVNSQSYGSATPVTGRYTTGFTDSVDFAREIYDEEPQPPNTTSNRFNDLFRRTTAMSATRNDHFAGATISRVVEGVEYMETVNLSPNCPETRKPQCAPRRSPPPSCPNKPPPPPPPATNWAAVIAALLAGLVGGGLLYYFLGCKNEEKEKENKCVKPPPPPPSECNYSPQTIPSSSSELPCHVPYLLIGGGTASFSAFRAIKSNDPKAKVLIISDELRKPYMRPPLSKELWYSSKEGDVDREYRFKQWTGAERSLYFEPDEFFVNPTKLMERTNGGVSVAQGFKVKKIDPAKRIVTLEDGYEIAYDECLIATGCSPKSMYIFDNAPVSVREKVMVYRTPEDFERLKYYADEGKIITIIGNGFTGSELACSLANYAKDNGTKIYQIYPESGNMSKVLPDYLSQWTTKKVKAQGVNVIPKADLREVRRDEGSLKLTLTNGTTVITDLVVLCVGCEPNTAIANTSGLEVCKNLGGFTVNAELEARRNLFVAGDASCFYDPLLGRRRVEHHDHSVVSGRLAGENMVGKKKPYTHQSMFWSDLGPDIGYEGIGMIDSSLPTVGVFALPSDKNDRTDNLVGTETTAVEIRTDGDDICGDSTPMKCNPEDARYYGRGVIFYLKNDKIVGILLWNLFNRIGLARTIINQDKKYEDLNEVAKLFEIHS